MSRIGVTGLAVMGANIVVQDGATVGKGARVHDSVVLKGATVEPDAVVVRSVIGPSGHVKKGDMVVEELVSGTNGRKRIE